MRFFLIIFITTAVNSICFAQSDDVNYVEYPYKYIDKNLKIKMSDKEYQETIDKFGFYRDRVIGNTYKDSLSVVMPKEFAGDWEKANRATFEVGYGWERIGYHLWISAEDAKIFAKKYGFTHPFSFSLFLRNSKNNDHKYIKEFFTGLREKVLKQTKDERVKTFTNSQLMDFAMYHSPERIKDFQEIVDQNIKRK